MNNTQTHADVDVILEKIRRNCILLSNAHKERYIELNDMLKYYKIPVIIISGVSSLVSVGQQFIPQTIITVCNGLFGLSCSIIVSIELYLGISQQLAQSASLTKEFYTLSTNIFKTLALSTENRTENSLTYLESIYGEYSSLCANSYVVKKNIIDSLIPLPEDVQPLERNNSIVTAIINAHRSSINMSTLSSRQRPPEQRQSLFGIFPPLSQQENSQNGQNT